MAEDEQDPKQRLVVDEDWKAQVEKEKAAARAQQAQPSTEAPAGEAGSAADRDAAAASDSSGAGEQPGSPEAGAEPPARADETASQGDVPPASFSVLVSMLFTQAMAALGQIPDPATGQPTVDRTLAKHYIDTLGMLEEKTQGNLSREETAMLSEALHALRMTFVSTK